MSEKLNTDELRDISGGTSKFNGYYEICCGNFSCKFCHCKNENEHDPGCHFHNPANRPLPAQRCTMCGHYHMRGGVLDCYAFA